MPPLPLGKTASRLPAPAREKGQPFPGTIVYDNAAQANRKKAELRELGVTFRDVGTPGLAPGLALGTYSSEAAAQQALQDVGKKGVRTARVAQEREETSAWNLRLPEVTDAQRATVTGLGSALVGKRLQRCT